MNTVETQGIASLHPASNPEHLLKTKMKMKTRKNNPIVRIALVCMAIAALVVSCGKSETGVSGITLDKTEAVLKKG